MQNYIWLKSCKMCSRSDKTIIFQLMVGVKLAFISFLFIVVILLNIISIFSSWVHLKKHSS